MRAHALPTISICLTLCWTRPTDILLPCRCRFRERQKEKTRQDQSRVDELTQELQQLRAEKGSALQAAGRYNEHPLGCMRHHRVNAFVTHRCIDGQLLGGQPPACSHGQLLLLLLLMRSCPGTTLAS